MATMEDLKKFECLFKQRDTNRNGTINEEDLADILKNVGFDVKEIKELSDTVLGDKPMTKKAFLDGMKALKPEQIERAKLRKTFFLLDKDKNGKLDACELKRALNTYSKAVNKSAVEAIISEIDRDGDGLIDVEEFLTAFLH